MEDRDASFRCAVRESYLAQAKEDPVSYEVIDARGGPEDVWVLTAAVLARRFPAV